VTQSVVSVVIAVFNDARHLPSAIESVRAQTRTGIEIVVDDDGSSDDSAGVAERLDVDQLIRLPTNQGPSMARNVGIARASGDLITFLDADDRMVPHRVARQEEFLAEHWELTGVFADQEPEVELGAPLPSWYGAFGLRPGESGGMPISVMFRSRALLEVGGFDPDLRMGEDIDVLMRCERFGMRIERLIEPLTVKTMHGANATYATDVMWSGLLGVVRRGTRPSPLVSVLVPMHDAGRYVAEAIESIRAQGRSDMEILVVDDGSEDDGPAIVRALAAHDPSIRLFSQPRAGAGSARNLGLLLARGRLIAMLDADDLWNVGKLEAQLARLEIDDSLDMVFGSAEEFVSPDLPPAEFERFHPRPPMVAHVSSTMLARRSSVARVGFFPVGRVVAEWPEWYMRARRSEVSMGEVHQLVARRRVHGANHSLAYDTIHTQYFDLLRRSIAARRAR
jgi:glycosyltransferase involved in cell wall biosynthesis